MRTIRLILKTSIPLFIVFSASCGKWTEVEPIGIDYCFPSERDPALWEQYAVAMSGYKSREHYIFYVEFQNGSERPSDEKSSLRNLPDSLDMVALANPEKISPYDREDMERLHKVGTKILYKIDGQKIPEPFADDTEMDRFISMSLATVENNGLDGWTVAPGPGANDDLLVSELISRLRSEGGNDRLIVLEGNPERADAVSRSTIDYFILDTRKTGYVQELRFQIMEATDDLGIAGNRILLATDIGSTITDENLREKDSLEEITRRVITYGPLGGMAVFSIDSDYYHDSGNYNSLDTAIQSLNPSK